jgi:hypothetical protein
LGQQEAGGEEKRGGLRTKEAATRCHRIERVPRWRRDMSATCGCGQPIDLTIRL